MIGQLGLAGQMLSAQMYCQVVLAVVVKLLQAGSMLGSNMAMTKDQEGTASEKEVSQNRGPLKWLRASSVLLQTSPSPRRVTYDSSKAVLRWRCRATGEGSWIIGLRALMAVPQEVERQL